MATLFDTLRERELDYEHCFLCGQELTAENRSDEHVIPKWAQERFSLWEQLLTLLNGTSIPYRQLVVPACLKCNGDFLRPLEDAVSAATQEGVTAVRDLGGDVLFTWLGKIFYGLLHKELFLVLDRTGQQEGTIADPNLVERFRLHHLFLQNVRVPMVFEGGFPASIFVYETKEPSDPQFAWDFQDGLSNMFISLRLGKVGIAAVLQDGGAQEAEMGEIVRQMTRLPLHPLQHIELSAVIRYKASLMNRVPKYLVVEGDPCTVMQLPLGGMSGGPIFNDWNPGEYAAVSAHLTHLDLDQIFVHPDQVMTWLRDKQGRYHDLSFAQCPWPPQDPSEAHR